MTRFMVLFITLVLVWAYNWVVTKRALQDMGAFDFTAWRTALGVLVLFVMLPLTGRKWRPPPLWPTLGLGLLQTFAYLTLMNWALVDGGAGKTSVLVFTMPFWTLLFAWWWLGETISPRQWPAVGLAVLGLVAIFQPWSRGAVAWLPQLLAVAGGVVWALSAVLIKRIRRQAPIDLLQLTSWQMLLGTIPMFLVAAVVPEKPIHWTPYLVFALIYAGVGASALGWWLWVVVLDKLPAGVAGLNVLAIPVLAVLAAWLELGERPNPAEWTGMLCIAIGLGWLGWCQTRQGKPPVDAEAAPD